MTSVPLPATSKRLPLLYIAALAGLAAGASAMLVLAAVAAWDERVLWVFPFACALAAAVAIVLGLPLHALFQVSGLTSRWVYVVGALIIVGVPYLWLSWGMWLDVDTGTFAIQMSLLVPAAAVPGGLLFHGLAHRALSVPPFERRDAFIIATWVAAWLFLNIPAPMPLSMDEPNFHRDRFLNVAIFSGLPAFMLLGILAGLARLWNWRLGLFMTAAAWFIPIAVAVMYLATPVGR